MCCPLGGYGAVFTIAAGPALPHTAPVQYPPYTLYIGGVFSNPSNVAVWDGSGAWKDLGGGVSGGSTPAVNSIALGPGGEVFVGGTFTAAGGSPALNIAVYSGGQWSPLGSGIGAPESAGITKLVVHQGTLVAGGSFTLAGGLTVGYVAAWDLSLKTWSALGSGLPAAVSHLAAREDVGLFACGAFLSIRQWSLPTQSWVELTPFFSAPVSLISLAGDYLFAAGTFESVGSITAHRTARARIVFPSTTPTPSPSFSNSPSPTSTPTPTPTPTFLPNAIPDPAALQAREGVGVPA
jgi:trimeric autotransporter adhesin